MKHKKISTDELALQWKLEVERTTGKKDRTITKISPITYQVYEPVYFITSYMKLAHFCIQKLLCSDFLSSLEILKTRPDFGNR